MIIDYKKLTLWGYDVVIRARGMTPHVILESLEEEACFYYVIGGRTRVYSTQDQVEVPQNEGITLQCGNYIGKVFGNSEDGMAEILIVKFPREVLKKVYVDDLPSLFQKISERKALGYKKINDSALLQRYVEGLLFYIENPQLAIEELLILKIRELFILLANTDNSGQIQGLIESLFQQSDFSFRRTVEQHLYANLRLEELAHICSMSLSTFKRRFKKEFEETPHRYIQEKKLERAREMICATDQPLALISDQCGFAEYSNFSLAFKKHFGENPSSLRS